MRRTTIWSVVIASALLFGAQDAISCSLARGYFNQVTRLRGNVVGITNYWPLLGYCSYPRWLRHRVARDNVALHLYEYRWPIRDRSETPLVKTITTDKDGRFDFGSVPIGHYTLVIDWPAVNADLFDVEIKKLPIETSFITIDVSPVDPDCRGGHELIVNSK